jgi:secretion/DNA translocation related TadE-like protein
VSDRGSVSVLILGIVGVVVVLGLMLGTAGQYLNAQSRAQAAADAAALAAAPVTFRSFGSEGSPAAEAARFAASNGAQLVRCICPIDRSWAARIVEVEVGREINLIGLGRREVRAKAAAEFVPVELLTVESVD